MFTLYMHNQPAMLILHSVFFSFITELPKAELLTTHSKVNLDTTSFYCFRYIMGVGTWSQFMSF